MGWEERNGHWYYYTKTRDGDRVTSVYYGAGSGAAALAQANAAVEEGRRAAAAERDEMLALDDACDAYYDVIHSIVKASLRVHGYHLHKGQWRKGRHGREAE